MVNNCINVLHVVNNLLVEKDVTPTKFGRNIGLENKLINSLLKNIIVPLTHIAQLNLKTSAIAQF